MNISTGKGLRPGLLISFEGLEGSGKTTQMKKFQDYLQSQGHAVQVFREPGGTPAGERIRDLLLHPEGQLEEISELLLFQAARHQLVKTKIMPALATNAVVLLDRFYDATFAYQGFGRGIPLETVEQLTALVTEGLSPDRTILLDVDPEVGLRRCLSRHGKEYQGADRIESSGLRFMSRVREGYLHQARLQPERIEVVRVTEDIESTYNQVLSALEPVINQWEQGRKSA